MSRARHRVNTRGAARTGLGKLTRLAVLSATVTATVVAVGVTGAGTGGDAVQARTASLSANAGAAVGSVDLNRLAESRTLRVSRTAKRVTLVPEPIGARFTTAPLSVWTQPRENGKRLGVIGWGSKVAVTGNVVGHWAEVVSKRGTVRWVDNDYLAKTKPVPEPEPEPTPEAGTEAGTDTGTEAAAAGGVSSGVSTAPCSHGSGPEAGLTSDAVEVYRAVCAAFSGVSSYGGYAPRGEHYDGRAIDIMVSGSYGQQIADWLRVNAGSLQIRNIIYAQRIWTPESAAEGWRFMEDRGSPTANHYDHVHVAVY